MAELKNYVEGQQIEPIKPRVYTTIEEQAELKAYREFGTLSQLRVLCDNYHELIDELRSRPTEAEIRAKAQREIVEWCFDNKVDFRILERYADKEGVVDCVLKHFTAEQLKED